MFTTLHSYLHLYIHICLGLRPGSRLPCGLQPVSALRCQALDRSVYTVVDFRACWNQCRLTGHRLLSSTTHDLDPFMVYSISLLDDKACADWLISHVPVKMMLGPRPLHSSVTLHCLHLYIHIYIFTFIFAWAFGQGLGCNVGFTQTLNCFTASTLWLISELAGINAD